MKTTPSGLDQGIGGRLRQFREQLKISRTAFALEIGIGSERLASYEAGRVPLRWEVFSAISRRFFLNPFWLATGKADPRLETAFDESPFEHVNPRSLFSDTMLDIVKQAGGEQDFEAVSKVTRLGDLLKDILHYAREGEVSQAMAAKLQETVGVWSELGDMLGKRAKRKADQRDSLRGAVSTIRKK